MNQALGFILLVVLAPLGIMTILFALQTLTGVANRARRILPGAVLPSMAVVVPAHDEEAGIRETLLAIRTHLTEHERLVVVADNCTDSTAEIATACGAEVCVRMDPEHRGKGYALDFGIRHLLAAPPQVVVIVDADCMPAPGALELLSHEAFRLGRPVQALYMMKAPPGAGLTTRIASFAWTIKNLVRPLGLASLGWPCQLMGTGMAFPWKLISTTSLGNGHLVEDMMLGLSLAERSYAPVFCPGALITSFFPSSTDGLKSQRYRWEHGHLSLITNNAPKALLRAVRTCNWPLAALAIDLMILPLALLILVLGLTLIVAAWLRMHGGMSLPLSLSLNLICVIVASVMLCWWKFGRDNVTLFDLCRAFGYVLWKTPLYLHFFVKRQIVWVRSDRS
jgi:cellulose synthase/poly-beta-1,6-N-acetylglucosamine synthase-like glycosyltransferase